MEGRIRFMTAITLAFAHAYQVTKTHACRPTPQLLAEAQSQISAHLPNIRATTRDRGNDFQGWAIYSEVYSRCGW